MRLHIIVALVAGGLAAGDVFAQTTLYKVTDRYGNVTYQDRPPDDDAQYEAKALGDDPAATANSPMADPGADDERIEAASREYPLVLFTVPVCDACDVVRWYLDERSLPFEEVNVESSISNQTRLRDATGEYRVPVLMVGERPLFGYDGEQFTAELQAAGYLEASAGTRDDGADDPLTDAGAETGAGSTPPSEGPFASGQGSVQNN